MSSEDPPRGAATEALIALSTEQGDDPLRPDDDCLPTHRGRKLLHMSLVATGVVYGDLGTNPLFAFREAFSEAHGLAVTRANVLGVLSLIFWSLTLVVGVKYTAFIMRAHDRGEGGTLALLAEARRALTRGRSTSFSVMLARVGAALLLGDGAITPAISVLSAVEGVQLAAPALSRLVLPIAATILVLLFLLQPRGTARIGVIFGPVMVLWFVTIGALGLRQIVLHPGVVAALSPAWAVSFFVQHGFGGILVLGAVILAVAGAEALYADMGHCGRDPIRLAWFALVFPALVCNYFGQGAVLLADAAAVHHPFYSLAPQPVLVPLIILATVATCIASQALITGSFSMTRQLMHLGYSPLVSVTHTSSEEEGQVYVPQVNWLLMLACLGLVLGFQRSERLSAAYGFAVSGTMLVTSLLFYNAMRAWGWKFLRAAAITAAFLVIDVAFFAANLWKIPHGGWVPVVIATIVFIIVTTWRRGRDLVAEKRAEQAVPLVALFRQLEVEAPVRSPGTGVFVTIDPDEVPAVLSAQLERVRALPENVLLLAIVPVGQNRLGERDRMLIEDLPYGFVRCTVRYGYLQNVDLNAILRACSEHGIIDDPAEATFYFPHERVRSTGNAPMARWRKRLFAFLQRNSASVTDFIKLPFARVVELGTVVEI